MFLNQSQVERRGRNNVLLLDAKQTTAPTALSVSFITETVCTNKFVTFIGNYSLNDDVKLE